MANRKIVAEWWWCGDEECNCWQPQIVERSTVPYLDHDWSPILQIDAGPFHSDPEQDEWDEMFTWMEIECEQRGIEIPKPPIERYWLDDKEA